MLVTLDGQMLFDEAQTHLAVGSPARAAVERSAAGLDGVLCIDAGRRGRRIAQQGTLRAAGHAQMAERIAAIESLIDGRTHILACGQAVYEDVRVESFEVTSRRLSGAGVVVEYEMVYRQLSA